MNKTYKKAISIIAVTTGFLAVSNLLDAAHGLNSASIVNASKMASDTIEIMAKSACNATDTVNASGTLLLDQFLGANGKYIVATLGGGGIAGWAVGYTLKKVAKALAIFLGVTFMSLQFLAYKNVITVDWNKVQTAMDQKYLEQSAESFMSVITYNLPFAGSFLVGFWLGFKKG